MIDKQKKIYMKRLVLILIALLPLLTAYSQQGVLIGKKEGAPNPFAKLEIYSKGSGLLVPRMTTAERTNINPDASAISLLVFDTNDSTYYFFNGIEWEKMSANRDIVLLTSQMDTLRVSLTQSLDSLGRVIEEEVGAALDSIGNKLDTTTVYFQNALDTLESKLTTAEVVDSISDLATSGDNIGDVTIVEDNGEGYRETFVWSDTNNDGEADTWVGVTIRPRPSGYNLFWFQDNGADNLTNGDFTDDKIIGNGAVTFSSIGYTVSTPYDGYYVLAFPSHWGRPEFYLDGRAMFEGTKKQSILLNGIEYQAWSFYFRIPATYTGPDLILTAVK